MKRYTFIRLKGGLGNQIYSLITGNAAAKERNCKVLLDVKSGFYFDLKYKRSFSISKEIPLKSKIKISQLPIYYFFRLLEILGVFKISRNLSHLHSNRFFGLIEIYVIDEQPKIKHSLIKHSWKIDNPFQKCEGTDKMNECTIHVRFFSEENNAVENVSEQYINRAVHQVLSLGVRKINVVSDNIERAQNWLKEIFTTETMEIFIFTAHVSDFESLINSQYLIISNSTFSYFAAFLSEHRGACDAVFFPTTKLHEELWGWEIQRELSKEEGWIGVENDL